jgi:putative cardiolipin synthase
VAKLKEQMKSAKKQIDIVSPYLWLSEEEIKFFKEWVQEDPERKVRLISNSIITTDNVPAQAMVDTILGPRLVSDIKGEDYAHQIEVYAFGKSDDLSIGGDVAYGKLHGKFSIIDGKKAIVGTSNLDPRSRYLNTELAISYEGKTTDELTTTLSDYMDRLVANSTLWGSDEWNQIRSHKKVKNLVHLQGFVGKIIHFFNLVPLI